MLRRSIMLFVAAATIGIAVAQVAPGTPPTTVPGPVIPDKSLKKLEALAIAIAKGGRSREAFEVVESVQGLGLDFERATKLVAACNKGLGNAKSAKESMPTEAKALAAIAKELAALLPTQDGDARRELARRILALDGSVDSAHVALGQEKIDGRWVCAPAQDRVRRRQEIVDALRAARQIEVDVVVENSDDAFSVGVFGERVSVARLDRVEIHSTRPPDQLARIVRETARGLAIYNFMLTGRLEVPRLAKRRDLWLMSLTEFKQAFAAAGAKDMLSERDKDHPEVASSCYLTNGFGINWDQTEAGMQATMLSYLEVRVLIEQGLRYDLWQTQPVLRMGCLDWICRAYFGTEGPKFTWLDASGAAGDSGARSESKGNAAEERERAVQLRMARAGIVGARNYLAWLAARHQDPPFETCLVDDIAKLAGVELLKASLVVDYLVESSRLGPLCDDVSADSLPNTTLTPRAMFERAFDLSLGEFDQRWRDWILIDDAGLVARLCVVAENLSKDERETLDLLNDIRTKAIGPNGLDEPATVGVDPGLSAGCRAHASYLAKHPDQAERWPDAHEEYPDKAGFSTAGAWAGLHSVIHPGQGAGVGAVLGWMATFYHRLPLTHPGVVRIGYGLDRDFCVLDASSLCTTTTRDWIVAWPYDKQTNVPLRFAPELPNPVPGEDQSKWGYPITAQRMERDVPESGEAVFELRKGGPKGPLVVCHVSTPAKPSNPDLAIPGTYCLMPKSSLEPKTVYHVTFKPADGDGKTWSFVTGS